MSWKGAFGAIGLAINTLLILYLYLQLYKVDPSRHRMYEEALKATGRGSDLCAAEGLTDGEREATCLWVSLENRRIINSAIASGRRH